MSEIKTKKHTKKAITPSVYKVNPQELPNGMRKPKEVCEVAAILQNWRERSAKSALLLK